MYSYKYSLYEIENMYPFELNIYIEMIAAKEEEKRKAKEQMEATRKMRRK